MRTFGSLVLVFGAALGAVGLMIIGAMSDTETNGAATLKSAVGGLACAVIGAGCIVAGLVAMAVSRTPTSSVAPPLRGSGNAAYQGSPTYSPAPGTPSYQGYGQPTPPPGDGSGQPPTYGSGR